MREKATEQVNQPKIALSLGVAWDEELGCVVSLAWGE